MRNSVATITYGEYVKNVHDLISLNQFGSLKDNPHILANGKLINEDKSQILARWVQETKKPRHQVLPKVTY